MFDLMKSRVAARYIIAGLKDLKPNEKVTMYHGTGLAEAPKFVNGFDANMVKSRLYGSQRHAGVYVTPSIQVAEHFSYHSQIILELEVQAKNLHGVDYAGNIGRDKDPKEIERIKKDYPDSFRPYLSYTLHQKVEPQALLRGLVKPQQIKRIRYSEIGGKPKWYTRKEFLALGLESGSGKTKKIKDLEADLSSPRHTLEEFQQILAKALDIPLTRVEKTLSKLALKGTKSIPMLTKTFEKAGFGETAIKSFIQKLLAKHN